MDARKTLLRRIRWLLVQAIDCSFGLVGFVPLWLCRKWAIELERLTGNGGP